MKNEDKKNLLSGLLSRIYELEGLVDITLDGKHDLERTYPAIEAKEGEIGEILKDIKRRLDAPQPPKPTPVPEVEDIADSTIFEEEADADEPQVISVDPSPAAASREEAKADAALAQASAFERKAEAEAKPKDDGLTQMKRLFVVGDLFRFRRELFADSQADFDASLRIVARFTKFSEAADYFFNDLQWAADDPTVSEFMDIIARRYNKPS